MSGPYQGRDLSNCGVGRLRVAINCGVLSVKVKVYLYPIESTRMLTEELIDFLYHLWVKILV